MAKKDTAKKAVHRENRAVPVSAAERPGPVKNTGRAKSLPEPAGAEDEEFSGQGLKTEIGIIAAFAVCLLFFLSNFGLCGMLGAALRSVMLGIFGVMGYPAPVIIFIGIVFWVSNRNNPKAMIKLGACVMGIVAVCVLIQLVAGFASASSPADFYRAKSGGGFIGGVIGGILRSVAGTVGAMLIQAAVLIVCGVCITEKSFVNFVRESSGHAVEQAREDMNRRQAMKADRKRQREETRVRGIDLASTELREAALSHAMDPGEDHDTGKKNGKLASIREYGKIPVTADDGLEVPDIGAGSPADRMHGKGSRPIAVGVPIDVQVGDGTAAGFAAVPKKPENLSGPVETAESGNLSGLAETAESGNLSGPAETAGLGNRKEPGMQAGQENRSGAEDRAATESLEESRADEFRGVIHHAGETAGRSALREVRLPEEDTSAPRAAEAAEKEAPKPAEAGQAAAEPAKEGMSPEIYRSDSRRRDIDLSEIYVKNDDTMTLEELTGEADRTPGSGDQEDDFSSADIRVTSTAPGSDHTPMTIVSGNPADTFRGTFGPAEETPEEKAMYQQADEPPQAAPGGRVEAPSRPSEAVVTATGKILTNDPGSGQDILRRKAAEARYQAERTEDDEPSIDDEIREKQEETKREYEFPPCGLLTSGEGKNSDFDENIYRSTAIKLQQTLKNFGVGVTVTNISCGPTVTRYELQPDMGVKVSRILALQDDIKLNLAAQDIRIEAPIPGKAAIGIEVPNDSPSTVYLRELLESPEFRNHPSKLAFAVGKDIGGQTVVADIAKMPHLLIAGATGSGKSVCINTMIMSIIYKAKPEEVQLMMIDPKVVELSVYNGIPHLLYPVVTDPKKAAGALNWAVSEMDQRYRKFAKYNVRDIRGYNAKVDSIAGLEMKDKPQKMPQIVIIIDELADLMMVAPNDVEDAICRLAQLARAAGIHLVIATQRPSVNVITGVIKANIPSRIAFSVASGVDSRTIIDMNGAEKLIGKGDMLFYPSGYAKPKRVQGAFVSDEEVSQVVRFVTGQGLVRKVNTEIENAVNNSAQAAGSGAGDRDAYFEQAGRFIIEKDKATIGMLQRAFKIGFNRAARIMDQLAEAGVVSGDEGTKARQVLMSMEQFDEMIEQGE